MYSTIKNYQKWQIPLANSCINSSHQRLKSQYGSIGLIARAPNGRTKSSEVWQLTHKMTAEHKAASCHCTTAATVKLFGATENARPRKCSTWKMTDLDLVTWKLVRHFAGAAFSSPSIWSVIFQPCFFSLLLFYGPPFSCPANSAPRSVILVVLYRRLHGVGDGADTGPYAVSP